jgi:FMN phosphatase YigB (HAD superfamily)
MPEKNVNVAGLATLLNGDAANCKVLSIDCFDTLLWRRVAAPPDAFTLLAGKPRFRQLGLTPAARGTAETRSRAAQYIYTNSREVTLAEIYRQAVPKATAEDIEALMAEELAVEKDACFPFQPVLDVVKTARERGMKVVVVSDTYFSQGQLKELLCATLGIDDATALFDDVFCSCDYRRRKTEGIFEDVIRKLGVAPKEIIHFGDNFEADYRSAIRAGLLASHFTAFSRDIAELNRMMLAAGTMLLPETRVTAPPHQICHALWAEQLTDTAPQALIGQMSVGPLMLALARRVADRALELKRAGRRPHLLFMLRDGWFPHRVYEKLIAVEPELADIPHGEAELPRFAAYASSFTENAAIEKYLTFLGPQRRYDVIAQQLLLDAKQTAKLTQGLDKRPDALQVFCKRVMQPKTLTNVATASKAFRARMMRHVRNATQAQPGDTLLLVDLGYNGTVQNLVQPTLEQELGVTVEGLYLLLRDSHETISNMSALLDRRTLDSRALDALLKPVSLLEQLSKTTVNSVVDYTRDGHPVRQQIERSASQDATRIAVQKAALAFVDAALGGSYARLWNDSSARHYTAVAALGRMLYLPGKADIDVFSGFKTDINLGVDARVDIFDTEDAALGLRRRGLSYLNATERPTLALEMRNEGIQLPLVYFTQSRFRFDLINADFNGSDQTVPVMLSRGGKCNVQQINVQSTHDGYCLALIGVDDLKADVGVMFGQKWSMVQLESVRLVSIDRLLSRHDKHDGFDVGDRIRMENIVRHGANVLQCRDRSGFMYVRIEGLGSTKPGTRYACAVVFRPLEAWPAQSSAQPALAAPQPASESTAVAAAASGRVTIPPRPASADAVGLGKGSICLLTCYLPNDPFVDEVLETLDRRLAERGVTLIVLTTYAPKHDRYRYLQVPYLLAGYSTLAVPPDNTAIGRYPRGYLEADARWQCATSPSAHTARGLGVCDQFYRRVLDTLEPDCVFIWNPTVPAGRVLQSLCSVYTVPAYGIERGVYPQTMMVDHLGIGAMGDLNLDLAVRQHARRAPLRPDVLQTIRDHYAQLNAGKYAAKKSEAGPEEFRRRHDVPENSRIISLFLSAAAANWSPRSLHGARYSSPWFADAAEAVQALVDSTPEDVRILVQDHPLNRNTTVLPTHPRLVVCDGEPIRSMIGASDLTAILGATTVQHEALLMDAPVLLLSRSQLSGKQVCYEYDGNDLAGLVQRAMRREDWAKRREEIARYVPFLFEHVLLGLADGPARTTVDDLATHVAAMATPHAHTIEERVMALMEQIDEQAKVA